MINFSISGNLRRFQIQTNFLNSWGATGAVRLNSVGSQFFGKFKHVNFVNTQMEVKDGILDVNRTAYLGIQAIPPNFIAALPEMNNSSKSFREHTIEEANIIEDFIEQNSDEEVDLPIDPEKLFPHLNPVETHNLESMPEHSKLFYEKFRGTLFLHFPEGAQIIHFFQVFSKTISWNQNTLLFLLLTISELNGVNPPKVSAEDFLIALKNYGITSSNWQSSIKKLFQINNDGNLQTITYSKHLMSSNQLDIERTNRFEAIVGEIRSSCEAIELILEEIGKTSTYSNSQKQLVTALAVLSARGEISTKEFTEILNSSKINPANWHSNLSAKFLLPIVIINHSRTHIALSKSALIFDSLKKYSSVISKIITDLKKKSINLADEKRMGNEILSSSSVLAPIKVYPSPAVPSKISYELNGYVSISESESPKIYFHFPSYEMSDNIETRKKILAIVLKLLKKRGESSISFTQVHEFLSENRLSKMNLPRDILRSDQLKCNIDNKTISLINPSLIDQQILKMSKYRVEREDISEKMATLIPLMNEIRNKSHSNLINRTDLSKICKEKKIALNFTRDIKHQFGFHSKDGFNIAPYPFDQALALLKQHKKKQA